MRQFGLSAAVVVALASPAWAQYPTPYSPDAVPAPAGYPMAGFPQTGYPSMGYPISAYAPDYYPTGDALRPDVLPPVSLPPGAPLAGPLPVAPSGRDGSGFPFDPCYPFQCARVPRVHNECWVRADWLYWSFRDAPVPPLIVTGDPLRPGAGIPGGGNIVALVGPRRDLGQFDGIRATFGRWFDPDGELGAEASGFIFAREGTADFFRGTPTLPLSVPFQSTDGELGVYDFSFPGRFNGSLGIRTANQLLGAESNLLHRWYGNGCVSLDGILGYRFLLMNERLELFGRSQSAGAVATFAGLRLPRGVTVFTTDQFRANNQFHGGQIGARLEVRRDMFTLTGFAKGGAGANIQVLRAEGNTVATGFGITRTQVGGLRALPSNFGRETNTDFSMISEIGTELGLQVTRHLSVRVGYNLLWWSDVLRPANVISPVLTPSQVPIDPSFSTTPVANARPVTVFRSSDFLAHGLVLGMLLEW